MTDKEAKPCRVKKLLNDEIVVETLDIEGNLVDVQPIAIRDYQIPSEDKIHTEFGYFEDLKEEKKSFPKTTHFKIKLNDNYYLTDREFFLFKRNVETNQMVCVGKYIQPREEVINAKTIYFNCPSFLDNSSAVNIYYESFYIHQTNYNNEIYIDQYCHFDEGFNIISPMEHDLENYIQISANYPEHPNYTIGFTKYLAEINKTIVTLWDCYLVK